MGLRENQTTEGGEGRLSGPNHLAPGRWRTGTRISSDSFHQRSRNDTTRTAFVGAGFERVECRYRGRNRGRSTLHRRHCVRARPSATDGRRPKFPTLGLPPQVRSKPPVFDVARIRFDAGHVAIRTACEAPTPRVCCRMQSVSPSTAPGIASGVAQAGSYVDALVERLPASPRCGYVSLTSNVSNSGGSTSIRTSVSRFNVGNLAPVSMLHVFAHRSVDGCVEAQVFGEQPS